MARLLFQGHGSFRIVTASNVVIYVDPYAGTGYDLPADIILVTHQHGDHNQIKIVAKKPDCAIIQSQDALIEGKYQSFNIKGVVIMAVPAYNKNHRVDECVGYIISFDGLKLYAAGDTSKTSAMAGFPKLALDYALLPIDGVYNMGPAEAAECARLIKARHTIPIHMKPGALFDARMAEAFAAENKLVVPAGAEIEL
jgi:L-ascorbate metabolism protein UlaG (beta-lactamase superfamily)